MKPDNGSEHWKQKTKRGWLGLRTAHQAMMLQDSQALLRQDREVIQAHHRQHLPMNQHPTNNDDMIHVGDVTNHVTQQPSTSKLLPLVVALASLVAGSGATLGLMSLLALRNTVPAPKSPEPSAPVVVPQVDDVELEVRWKLGP
ncbi:MAG: hypothetical protein JNM56_28395, partial [Planctomycetia bacterium]|nr:hypothetical protein [Planctomycetia bacterium]